MDFLKHKTEKLAGPDTSTNTAENNGHGKPMGKAGNSDQMNASHMIKKEFVQQVPAAGTDAGKTGTGKEMQKMSCGEVSAYGMDAGK